MSDLAVTRAGSGHGRMALVLAVASLLLYIGGGFTIGGIFWVLGPLVGLGAIVLGRGRATQRRRTRGHDRGRPRRGSRPLVRRLHDRRSTQLSTASNRFDRFPPLVTDGGRRDRRERAERPALRRSRAARNPRRRSCTRTQRRNDGTQAHTQAQRAGARSDRRRLGRPHGLRQRRRGQAGGGSADEIRRHGDRGRQAVASLRPEVGAGRARDRRTHEHGQGVSRGPARSPRPRPHAAGRAEGHSRRRGAPPAGFTPPAVPAPHRRVASARRHSACGRATTSSTTPRSRTRGRA